MGIEVTIVEPWALVVVRFANVVGVGDAVLFVEAGLLETSLPELGELVVVSGGMESENCAEEGVGEKEGRRERKKRMSTWKRFMAPEKRRRARRRAKTVAVSTAGPETCKWAASCSHTRHGMWSMKSPVVVLRPI